MSLRVLVLGGTTEASALARALAGDARYAATLSLAGRTRAPVLPPIPHRIGGFGGAAGLARYLRETGTDLLLDATHPFAARISAHAAAASHEAGIALLAVRRPAWHPGPGDRWTGVADMPAAASALGRQPRRVLLTVGQLELLPFAAAPWHTYAVRSVEPPPPGLLPAAEVITARGPFDEAGERALLIRLGTELLVTKNSGGTATAAKLAAARALGLSVVMVARPPPSGAEWVEDVPGALEWLARHHVVRHHGAALRGV